jgi:hypothetical protein
MESMLVPPAANEKPVVSRSELISVIVSLRHICDSGELEQLQPTGPATVYTTTVTLWMLISQRLSGGQSLEASVKDFIANRPSFCPDNKRLDEKTLSTESSAYAGARKRLDLATVKYLFNRVTDSIAFPKLGFGQRPRQTFLLDGTTITLAPTDELKRVFPPATNQHGESVWPVMLLFVAHDLKTGCACVPEVGRMYGGKGDSEALLCERLVKRLPQGSIVMADAGLGIFRVAYHSIQSKHDILFRLTTSRFESLTKKAKLISERYKSKTWELDWKPTLKDRKGCPGIDGETTLRVLIHEIEINDGEKLYLVTTLPEDSQSLADRYRKRYDVETDIECIKVAMNTEQIAAQSEAMVMKELYTSLIAYNLVIQFRRQAAELSGVEPRRLSFQGVWDTYESFLATDLVSEDIEACVDRFEHALQIASKQVIPNRPGRNYKRAAHPRRPKTTKWQKAQRKKSVVKSDATKKPPDLTK